MTPEQFEEMIDALNLIESNTFNSWQALDSTNQKIDSQILEIIKLDNDIIEVQNNQIFILNSIAIGIAFVCGYFMYSLLKKNFMGFGADL